MIDLLHISVDSTTRKLEAAQFLPYIERREIMEQQTHENKVKVDKRRTRQLNLPRAKHELQA